ncbi:hypothetical protein Prum_031410 [Phytohabitans rumicis]|uniref:Uncharacterized protein n=1 Tax=Phytohabitans rumicis TaxID=1076125 RepID=A0A6V8L4E3_9ACTN|nr:hypothetical protein Prum_031410 [Phytohabitans rumicis]
MRCGLVADRGLPIQPGHCRRDVTEQIRVHAHRLAHTYDTSELEESYGLTYSWWRKAANMDACPYCEERPLWRLGACWL